MIHITGPLFSEAGREFNEEPEGSQSDLGHVAFLPHIYIPRATWMMQVEMDVIAILREHRGDVDVFGVSRIGVFGSHARGEGAETSDVDVLVEFDEPTFDDFMDLVFYLEELFGKDVELVTTSALSPHIASAVLREVVWCE